MRLFIILIGLAALTPGWSQPTANLDYYAEAKKAKTAKNYTLAVENFKKATDQKSDFGEAWYELGWCYSELKKYQDAVNALKIAKTLMKNEPRVYFESGYANDFADNIDDAIADYKRCIELDADYSGAYRQLGNIYFDVDKDYVNALKYYEQYINHSLEKDITSKTWYKKGYSEIETGQYEDAVISLKRSVALDNKYASAYDELGYVNYKLNRADEAIDAYTASGRIDPSNSAHCSGLGDVYRFLKKDKDQAFNWYKKGVEVNPKSQNSNFGVGWCYNEKADYNAAIPYLKKAIEINNKNAASYTELGYSYYGLKRFDEALSELDKSVKLFKGGVPYYYMGLCYVAQKQKDKAMEVYDILIDLKSKDAPVLLAKINAM